MCHVLSLAKQYGHILHVPGHQQCLSWPALLNLHVYLLQTCKPGVSPIQAIQLCWAVYQFHFQFLVFLGSYVKLLDVFYAAKQAKTVSCTNACQCIVESIDTDPYYVWCLCIFSLYSCIETINVCMSVTKERCYFEPNTHYSPCYWSYV